MSPKLQCPVCINLFSPFSQKSRVRFPSKPAFLYFNRSQPMTPHLIPVMLHRAENYDIGEIKTCLDRSRQLLGPKGELYGRRVLLKPNLISGRAPALACTDGTFISAVAQWFVDCGAQVMLGDSPAFGSLESVMRRHAIIDKIAHLGLTIRPFKTVRRTKLPHGVTIGIAEEALDCDLFVNLPKVKAHNQMYLTAAVKNLFGIVCGMRKAVAHMKNGSSHIQFADLMLDLAELLPDNISIADGILAMHREGPVSGDPLKLGCLAMSRDPVALDTTLLDLLELNAESSPVWRAARRRNLPGSYLENIKQGETGSADFHQSGFVAPLTLSPIPFNPFRFFSSVARRISLGLTR